MSFDLLAPHYTWMEKLLAGPRLQRCRLQWIDHLAGCERILIAGVGHGHFLRACAERFPAAAITSVDASAEMLRHAERRAGTGGGRLTFVHASLPDWRPAAAAYDAIVTHFFLDCFAPDQLVEVVGALANSARAEATWLLSDFTVPEHGWRRQRAKAIQASMYAFFRPIAKVAARRVTPPDALLRDAGFTLVQRRATEWGLLHSDLWRRPM